MAVRGRGVLLAGLMALASVTPAFALAKHEQPVPSATLALMAARATRASAPILIRTFKKEAELEVWKQNADGRFVHLKTFPICRWSGQLGPKTRTGDRQTPEGFYTVAKRQMNPNSSYYLSFDVGFPNAFDKARGATGSFIMVHGTCSSMGCFAMTDAAVGEIYALARDAFAGGQGAFQFHSYPFRMTAENLARHRTDPNIAFWRNLKEGSDRFEATGEELGLSVANGRYAFAPSRDPAREAAAQARRTSEDAKVSGLVADGIAAIRTTYSDGGQHPVFAAAMKRGVALGEVSRPEALLLAGREVTVIPARRRPPTLLAATPAPRPAQAAPEMTPFSPQPLGPAHAMAGGALLAGAAGIVPSALARAPLKLASTR